MLIYVLLAIIVVLIALLVWSLARTPEADATLIQMNQSQQNQISELLNRLQAPDARTFQALQNFSNLPVEASVIVPRDDESEAMRYRDTSGLGYPILDDNDIRQYSMQDLGIGFPPDEDFR